MKVRTGLINGQVTSLDASADTPPAPSKEEHVAQLIEDVRELVRISSSLVRISSSTDRDDSREA